MTRNSGRDKRKRRERQHAQWMEETSEQRIDPRAGEFIVLLWPDMIKTKPMSWTEAEKIWRNHTDRAMIFSKNDFGN